MRLVIFTTHKPTHPSPTHQRISPTLCYLRHLFVDWRFSNNDDLADSKKANQHGRSPWATVTTLRASMTVNDFLELIVLMDYWTTFTGIESLLEEKVKPRRSLHTIDHGLFEIYLDDFGFFKVECNHATWKRWLKVVFHGRLQIIVYACFELARLDTCQMYLSVPFFSTLLAFMFPRKALSTCVLKRTVCGELSCSDNACIRFLYSFVLATAYNSTCWRFRINEPRADHKIF